jgi:hypothetical protein
VDERSQLRKVEEHAAPAGAALQEILEGIRVVGQGDKAVLPPEACKRPGGDPQEFEPATVAPGPDRKAYRHGEKRLSDLPLGLLEDLGAIYEKRQTGRRTSGAQDALAPGTPGGRKENLERERLPVPCFREKSEKRKKRIRLRERSQGKHELSSERKLGDQYIFLTVPERSDRFPRRTHHSRKEGFEGCRDSGAVALTKRKAIPDGAAL